LRLADAVVHCAAGVVVVACGVGERPGIAVIGSRVGVRGAAPVVARAQVRAAHTGGGAGRCVRIGIVGHAVGCDTNIRVRLADTVVDRTVGVVVVARGIREGPGVTGIGPGVGVRGAAQIQARAQVHAAHTAGRAGGGVRIAIVGRAVGRYSDDRVRFADTGIDGAV